jgi:Carbohydrate-selective porin, OprB family
LNHTDCARLRAASILCVLGLGIGCSDDVSAYEGVADELAIAHQFAGIDFSGGLTWYLQSSDGAPQNATALSYSADLGLKAAVSKHGKVVIALEAGDGKGIDATLNSLSTAGYDPYFTNLTDAAPDSVNVVVPTISQLYYEGDYPEENFVATVGKLDVNGMFDENAYANDETDQFMSGIFVRSSGTSFAELDQYYAPGVTLQYSASKLVDLTFIAANGNGDGFNDVFDYMYIVGQVTFKPRLGGQSGNYRFYAVSDNRRSAKTTFTRIGDGSNTSNTAWGVSFDQALADGVGLFARYSTQDDGIAENIVKSSWSLGSLLEGILWGRERDTMGIGYGIVMLNDNADLAAALGTSDTGDESHIEAFYKFGVTKRFTLTVDAQAINNNGGNAATDTVTVAGLRAQLNF